MHNEFISKKIPLNPLPKISLFSNTCQHTIFSYAPQQAQRNNYTNQLPFNLPI
ncbi:hypothetical protein THERMOT_1984 [Bathymodiolus thermophilus thioautotrophic gill symbiont]|uniref:Uncharacterized protein n=1 Tax=Bathymodiolus thermophilus thioautotrophic gill symbiont TaxID=2360 RepID=A0A8H8XD48_9GAMM|nr:hypothetical protein THERMOS_1599 [Bathymodiolus thermophilus thioautotrophic gill symbiont]CAB5504548.1 hypothetical protein THERMOT_1984 [Bathymodiolus thermophilus thioautotrophic gill symbiont]